jgi:hypothetical protein
MTAVCLCNLGAINPSQLARRAADVYLAGVFKEGVPAARAAAPAAGRGPRADAAKYSPGQLEEFEGRYDSEELDTVYTVFVESRTAVEGAAQTGNLAFRAGNERNATLLNAGPQDQFAAGGTTLRFLRGTGARVDALIVDAGRVRGIRFERR